MQRFSIKEAIGFGWETVKHNLWFFAGLMALTWLVPLLSGFWAGRVKEVAPTLSLLLILAGAVASIFIGMGLVQITLRYCDGKQSTYGDLFTPARRFWTFVAASILYALIVLLGLLLFIIPGIIWSIKYSLFRYIIIDSDLGALEALAQSGKLTDGSKWQLFLLGVVLGPLNVVGAFSFGIGLIITVPISLVAGTFVYRKLLVAFVKENAKASRTGDEVIHSD